MKLPVDFFEQLRVRTLLKKPNGEKYCVLFMRMMLKCLDGECVYPYEGVFPTIEAEIAAMFDESEAFASEYVTALTELGFAERTDEGLFFPEMCDMVGSECASAERVRNYRARKNAEMLQCNSDVTECNVEKIREDKRRVDKRESVRACARETVTSSNREGTTAHGQYKNVYITEAERAELIGEFGEAHANSTIERLSVYIQTKGDKYCDHSAVIRQWAADDAANKGDTDSGFEVDEYFNAALKRSKRYLNDTKAVETSTNEDANPP